MAVSVKIDDCPLHRRRGGSFLHYTRNSRGLYATYAPRCNGCAIGEREMLEFELCGNVDDAVVRVRECMNNVSASETALRLELGRLKAEQLVLISLGEDSDMCLNTLDRADETIKEAEAVLAKYVR